MKSKRFDRQTAIATSGAVVSSAARTESFDAPYSEPAERLVISTLGASASDLATLENSFDHMPVDADIAFIVMQHLAPDHAGALIEEHADSPGEGPEQCEHCSKSRPYRSAKRYADHQELNAAIGGTRVILIEDKDRAPLAYLLPRVRH
jgi:hypothetical protein